MIYVFTGKIRTGKTTALYNWIENKHNIDGLLCPDDANGKRYFITIKSKETFKLEAEMAKDHTISVGPFHFFKTAFTIANLYLIAASEEKTSQYLIIDEIGKLELKNEGLHDAAKVLIPQYMLNEQFHLILVIRDALLDEVLKHYSITKTSVLTKAALLGLK